MGLGLTDYYKWFQVWKISNWIPTSILIAKTFPDGSKNQTLKIKNTENFAFTIAMVRTFSKQDIKLGTVDDSYISTCKTKNFTS